MHKIYFIGDSLTLGTPADLGTYPYTVGALLGSSWTIVNNGHGGRTTTKELNVYASDLKNHSDAEYVCILLGVNDLNEGESADTVIKNLQKLYTLTHNAGIKTVAITILPHNRMVYSFGKASLGKSKMDTVNYWILHTAKDVDYRVNAYAAFLQPHTKIFFPLKPEYDSGDHLHLSERGYEIGRAHV